MHLRSALLAAFLPLSIALVACSAETADDGTTGSETVEEALVCGDLRGLVVDPSDPNDDDFTNISFVPEKATWWSARNDDALRSLRAGARRGAPGSVLVRESVVRNGATFRYTYRTFRPEVALPTDIRIEGLEGCAWSKDDSAELARLRSDARAVAQRNGAVITFERVFRAPQASERWSYEYRYDAPLASKPSGVTFVPPTMDWRTDDQAALDRLRRGAQDEASSKRLRVTSETVTARGTEWSYAYLLGK